MAKEGEYGAYNYGVRYGRSASGEPQRVYQTSDGKDHTSTMDKWDKSLQAVKKPSTGVVQKGFKVTETTDGPWFTRPEVNRNALDAEVRRYGRPR